MDKIEKQWVKVDQYTQIKADKYNNKYSIILGSQGQNDVVYPKYVCPQIWRNGEKRLLEKNGEPVFVPLSIFLGTDKEKALKIWAAIEEQLERL